MDGQLAGPTLVAAFLGQGGALLGERVSWLEPLGMPTFWRDLLTGAVLGFLAGLVVGLGSFVARLLPAAGQARPEYDVAAVALLVEVGSLTAMGLALGGAVAVARLGVRLFGGQVVLVIGLTGALLGMRVALGLGARAATHANRPPATPDEPWVILAALAGTVAVFLLGQALMARANRTFRILLPLVGVSVVLVPVMLGVATFLNRFRAAEADAPRLEETARRWGVAAGAGLAGREAAPNVLVITIDSLRPDYLGSYGHPEVQTPYLDTLADQGARFTAASTVQPTTLPAHISLLTGLYPANHGARIHIGALVDDRFDTLPMILKGAGYETGAFYTYIGLRPEFSNLQRGFDDYADTTLGLPPQMQDPVYGRTARLLGRLLEQAPLARLAEGMLGTTSDLEGQLGDRADVTTDAALAWLDARQTAPFFLWVHYFGPHYPYTPPPPFDTVYDPGYTGATDGGWPTIRFLQSDGRLAERDVQHVRALYAGEVSFTDQQIGRLFERLRQSGAWDKTIVAVLADHGQSLGENDLWFHNSRVAQAMSAIPLLVRYPPLVPPSVVEVPVQTIDVMPTILEMLGIGGREALDGRSLLPLMRGEEDGVGRVAIVERGDRGEVAVREGDWRLVWDVSLDQVALYDLRADPFEGTDLSGREPQIVARLKAIYQGWAAAYP